MTPETLVCAEHIAPARLSALRDGALAANQVERLSAHVATCAACRARLEDYDQMASAIRAQRELEPRDRIISGVRAQLTAPRVAHAHLWRLARGSDGVARLRTLLPTLAAVAALILLFVSVFSVLGHTLGLVATAPATATATFFKPNYPTATPETVQVPAFTAASSATGAWGASVSARSFTFAPGGGYSFRPEAFASDLSVIAGPLINVATAQAGIQQNQAPIALYDTATGAITRLGIGGDVVTLDSRYLIYGYNDAPGATCGVCHNTLWSYDRATGRTWEIDPGPKRPGSQEVLYSGLLSSFVSADHVAFMTVEGQIWVADLATRAVKVAAPVGSQPADANTVLPQIQLLGFQWPYLMYTQAPIATPGAPQEPASLYILNLETGANTPIAVQLPDRNGSAGISSLLLIGSTLYVSTSFNLSGVDTQGQPVNVNYGELYQLDNAFTSGSQFTFLARWPIGANPGDVGMTTRVISLGSGYFWDLKESRLIQSPIVVSQVVGPYLISINAQPQNSYAQTYTITIYDSSHFAAHG